MGCGHRRDRFGTRAGVPLRTDVPLGVPDVPRRRTPRRGSARANQIFLRLASTAPQRHHPRLAQALAHRHDGDCTWLAVWSRVLGPPRGWLPGCLLLVRADGRPPPFTACLSRVRMAAGIKHEVAKPWCCGPCRERPWHRLRRRLLAFRGDLPRPRGRVQCHVGIASGSVGRRSAERLCGVGCRGVETPARRVQVQRWLDDFRVAPTCRSALPRRPAAMVERRSA